MKKALNNPENLERLTILLKTGAIYDGKEIDNLLDGVSDKELEFELKLAPLFGIKRRDIIKIKDTKINCDLVPVLHKNTPDTVINFLNTTHDSTI